MEFEVGKLYYVSKETTGIQEYPEIYDDNGETLERLGADSVIVFLGCGGHEFSNGGHGEIGSLAQPEQLVG
jgi:hypothetical protein